MVLLLLALPASAVDPEAALVADKVIVIKHERRLILQRDGAVLREYRVALGRNPVGHKLAEGDGRTPEGLYRIDARNPNSRFFRSLRISYPNADDKASAAERNVEPGGQIMIHGLPGGRPFVADGEGFPDWTEGCIAVTNEEMMAIWSAVPVGTPIEIRP